MKINDQTDSKRETKKPLIEAVIAYIVFCGLSFLSRFAPAMFLLVVVSGIVFPLIWAKFTKSWRSIGFTRQNLKYALLWGLGGGLVSIVYVIVYLFIEFGKVYFSPPMLGLQLIFGIPIWILVLSPFQEFFFRGWLQPRFQDAMGKWTGLFVTSLCFSVWHFFPPFEGTPTSTLPVSSVLGFLSCFGLGVLWGYTFQRTDNIVAPWLSHALGGIALVVTGVMSFVRYTP